MKRKPPKYVHEYEDRHGTLRRYLRRPGAKKIPLPGALVLLWSPEFMAAYEKALKDGWTDPKTVANKSRPIIAGTVNAAVISYFQSSAFKDGLSDGSQKMRRAILETFRKDHGHRRIAEMRKQHLQTIINGKTPAAALNWKKALRGFLNHCLAMDFISIDPLVGVTFVAFVSNGYHTWTTEECQQFEKHHAVGTRARLAYELLLQASQSRCDVIRMGRQHIKNGMMSMNRQKTGAQFNVTVTPSLQRAIDAMPASNHLTFLITAFGKPFTAAGFGNWFREVCDEAEMPKRCTSHGLRKAAAAYFAEQGATEHQLMAWFGWLTISQALVYTRAASRKRMAESAGKLIAGTGIGSPANPVSQNDPQVIEVKGRG